MGFLLASNALLVLYLLILVYKQVFGDDWSVVVVVVFFLPGRSVSVQLPVCLPRGCAS